jgi:hypothetical protein
MNASTYQHARRALAFLFYAAALILIYCGFAVPGSDGLNHHVRPANDAEWLQCC